MVLQSRYIPVPEYPRFNLRSSLINKDPVIWAHLLEGYVKLFKSLLESDVNYKQLEVKSQQQLQRFLQVYMSEESEASKKTISIGAVNPDIRTNSKLLRAYVFHFIKLYSPVRLNLSGKSLWDFVKLYVEKNATVVRGLVNGTFKSKYNDNKKSGNISHIGSLQKYLLTLIETNHLQQEDLEALSLLVGQFVNTVKTKKKISIENSGVEMADKKVINTTRNASSFAEAFATPDLIEALEKLHENSREKTADMTRNVMILVMISLSVSKISNLASSLGIENLHSLSLYPVFSSIMTSESYKELVPGVEDRLKFLKEEDLNALGTNPVNETHIVSLCELFPDLTPKRARNLLQSNDDNLEKVTDLLLSDSALMTTEAPKVHDTLSTNGKASERFSHYDNNDRLVNNKDSTIDSSLDVKQQTLNAALRLLYESDEDEPDDTYDDQEKTTGLDENFENDNISSNLKISSSFSGITGSRTTISKIEWELFDIFKTKGPNALSKSFRKTKERKKLKEITGWSDEQIEGWLSMLMKSPKRFKVLEEEYFYSGNPNRKKADNENTKNHDEPLITEKD